MIVYLSLTIVLLIAMLGTTIVIIRSLTNDISFLIERVKVAEDMRDELVSLINISINNDDPDSDRGTLQ